MADGDANREGHADFIIKFDQKDVPTPPGGAEVLVRGNEGDAIRAMQDLVEHGQTTPGRMRLYRNLSVTCSTSIEIPPDPPRPVTPPGPSQPRYPR